MSDGISVTRSTDPRTHALLRETERRLQLQNDVMVDLARRPSVQEGKFEEALREITEAAADTLAVDRVSVWFYDDEHTLIRCIDQFTRKTRTHTRGAEVTVASNPGYFEKLENARALTVHDVSPEARTAALTDETVHSSGIRSTIDAPIRRLGRITGLVRHTSVGKNRQWTIEDENFTASIADLVAIVVDAAEQRAAETSLRRRLQFEQIVSRISSRFVEAGADDIEEAAPTALRDIALFACADRSFVILLDDEQMKGAVVYEWCAEGVAPNRELLQRVVVTDFPYTFGKLRRMHAVQVDSPASLPAEAAAELELMRRVGLHSFLVVPMMIGRKLLGMLGVTSNAPLTWPDDALDLMQIVGNSFAGTLNRVRTEQRLRESEYRYRTLFERNLAGVYRNTIDGRMLDCNDAMARMLGYSSREEVLEHNASDSYADPQERSRFVERLLRERSLSAVEVELRRRDGSPLWLLESVHIVEGTDELEGTAFDITNHKLGEMALFESESRYRLLAENATDLISRLDSRGKILYASPALQSLLMTDPSAVIGRSIFEFIEPVDHEVVRLATITLARRPTITFSYRVRRPDGKEVWFETTCRAIKAQGTRKITEFVTVSRDISERKRVEEHVEFQAYHDELTGLPNRTLFRDRLTIALAQARRTRKPLAVMFIDLDSFKVVNDTLGHSLGDDLLKALAARLTAVVRAEDTIARMGGDEFTILAANLNSVDDASLVAEKLLETISKPIELDGSELFVTASIGIALYPDDGDTVEALLKNADNAMYRAKEGGRNSYKLCTPAMNRRALERLSTENALRRAIDRREFVLHYQPLVLIRSGKTVGMEALLRWNRPDHGLIEPSGFIAIAEETRMIVPLGEWVLQQACATAQEWQARHPGVRVSVNLSPRQFQHNDLPRMVAAALDESKLDPSLLELEITEGTAMMNNERTVTTMRNLRGLGIRLAIDDFGTGQSSLNYLHSFPIDGVKVDQAFVRGIESSASDRAIVSAVIAMARGLELRVTAEGVETQGQLEFLRECDCEEGQGFLFGAAMPPHELRNWRGPAAAAKRVEKTGRPSAKTKSRSAPKRRR